MDKVVFITARYGEEINGGVEVHCRMLATRLSKHYDVEVLTTRVLDAEKIDEHYPEGTSKCGGVTIKRFNTQPFDADKYKQLKKKIKYARKLRRFLYRLKFTRFIFYLFPVWHLSEDKEYAYLRASGFYSRDLFDYIKQNTDDIKAIILMSYPYPLSHFGSMIAPEKTILIPTAHEESMLFYSVNTQLFNRVAHVAFNTETEQHLCRNIFSRGLAGHSIVSTGVELTDAADFQVVKNKYGLPDKYALYFGRVCEAKIDKLFAYFNEYKKRCRDDLYLVITGEILMDLPENDFIKFTGFVNEAEKTAIISNALIVINPSPLESLSLLVLEAMKLGRQVLVNGKCKVLRQHCIDSGYAADCYTEEEDFCDKLNYYFTNDDVRQKNKIKAQKYVEDRCDWNVIMPKLESIIEGFAN